MSAVDEVEVPHHKVGANRFAGKIERSAGASQGCYTLIHCPFDKQNVKAIWVTSRQIFLQVAHGSDWLIVVLRQRDTINVYRKKGRSPPLDDPIWSGTSVGVL
ncbi:MAG: hypothetical protein JSV68_01475 [Anaerolineaceae bacterium]|nr:MAG: hypothetical protein JSV68_01475 [Anaerolineaceae bacterium]